MTMTTLAYKDGVLAADTKITGGNMTHYGPKIARLPDGGMVAVSGMMAPATAFVEWMVKGQKGKRPGVKEIDALMVKGDGSVWSISEKWPPVRLHGVAAAGSGSQAAMAGMTMGLGAKEAVELACKIDPESGGEVQTMEVEKR